MASSKAIEGECSIRLNVNLLGWLPRSILRTGIRLWERPSKDETPCTLQSELFMTNRWKIFYIGIYEVRVCGHCVSHPDHHRPPGSERSELCVVLSTQQICDVDSAHVVAVVIEAYWDRQFFLLILAKCLFCSFHICALFSWALAVA